MASVCILFVSKQNIYGQVTVPINTLGVNGNSLISDFDPTPENTVLLHVLEGITGEPQLRFVNEAGPFPFYDIGMDGSNKFTIEYNDNPAVTLLPTGEMGIGIENPTSTFHIQSLLGNVNGFKVESNSPIGVSMNMLASDPGGEEYAFFSTANGASEGAGKFLIKDINDDEVRMTIDPDGFIGFGLTDPSSSLHVKSLLGNVNGFKVESNSDIGVSMNMLASNPGGEEYAFFSTANGASEGAGKFLIKDINDDEVRMTIDPDGFIGFGLTDPSSSLHVKSLLGNVNGFKVESNSDVGVSMNMLASNPGGEEYAFFSTANGASEGAGKFLIKDVNEDEVRMTIDPDGFIGFGLTDPSSSLHVKSLLGNVNGFKVESNSDVGVSMNMLASDPGGQEYAFFSTANGASEGAGKFLLKDITNDEVRLTVAANGKIGINNTDPGNYMLNISQTGSFGLLLENSTANGTWEQVSFSGSSGALALYQNGNLRGSFNASTGAYTSISDRSRKNTIRSAEDVLKKVNALEVSRYKFNGDPENKDHLGFIAQDVEKIFPELVSIANSDRADGIYTMDYSGFGIISIKAIQELSDENDELKSRLAKLEAQMEALLKD